MAKSFDANKAPRVPKGVQYKNPNQKPPQTITDLDAKAGRKPGRYHNPDYDMYSRTKHPKGF